MRKDITIEQEFLDRAARDVWGFAFYLKNGSIVLFEGILDYDEDWFKVSLLVNPTFDAYTVGNERSKYIYAEEFCERPTMYVKRSEVIGYREFYDRS